MALNATITGTRGVPIPENEQARTRKLLVKRRELDHLIESKKQGRSIVPLEILTGGRYIKVRIAIGKGKKLYDKRQTLKKRDRAGRCRQRSSKEANAQPIWPEMSVGKVCGNLENCARAKCSSSWI